MLDRLFFALNKDQKEKIKDCHQQNRLANVFKYKKGNVLKAL
jgi:hypothetical protein